MSKVLINLTILNYLYYYLWKKSAYKVNKYNKVNKLDKNKSVI